MSDQTEMFFNEILGDLRLLICSGKKIVLRSEAEIRAVECQLSRYR